MNEIESKKTYEISFLISSENDANVATSVISKYGEVISPNSFSVKKIPLSYRIKKHQEAFFGFFNFTAPESSIEEIKKELNLNTAILRFLIIIPPKPIKSSEPKKTPPSTDQQPAPSLAKPKEETERKPAQPGEALSNEALEKKLEEILG